MRLLSALPVAGVSEQWGGQDADVVGGWLHPCRRPPMNGGRQPPAGAHLTPPRTFKPTHKAFYWPTTFVTAGVPPSLAAGEHLSRQSEALEA